MTYSLQQRKRRWCDFLDMAKPAQHMFIIACDPDAPARPLPNPGNVPQRIEWSWQSYCRQMERMNWLQDDTVPFLAVYTGTEIFAEAFGCPVVRPADNMPHARPLVCSPAEAARIKTPRLEETPLVRLFDIADELCRRAGKGALLGLVDIQSPMDIAALIWDKSHFYIAMVETPQAVLDLAGKVNELLVAFMDEWFVRYGPEFIAHYPSYYMPRGITLSEDEIGSVSQETFLELFLPELVELSKRYGGLGMHCCANAGHQWENLLKIPDFRLLNLCQSAQRVKEAYEFFGPRLAQMHSWSGDGAPEGWPQGYPQGSRVVMSASAGTEDEAKALADKLWNACGRG